jgi:hypothetical protein
LLRRNNRILRQSSHRFDRPGERFLNDKDVGGRQPAQKFAALRHGIG